MGIYSADTYRVPDPWTGYNIGPWHISWHVIQNFEKLLAGHFIESLQYY